ncbi:type-2 ice-structuring protein-like isoform X2 [Betta splendens]|uniref:Type-2 ice-structuring protein-like isoform X2 n=1 Tax=Betta splendens TaxID=158456 RepID=A0A9W2Y7Y5_BETSP|nr:type-2 ice-structuring protein-like isoform X2 [Betta splendens]
MFHVILAGVSTNKLKSKTGNNHEVVFLEHQVLEVIVSNVSIMKLLMLCALLYVVALTRAADKGADKQVQQPDEDVSQLEKRTTFRCPRGWTKYSGRCFHFVPRYLPWAEAEKNCRAMGGHLASLRNRNEYFWVQHLINYYTHTSPETWIGGSSRTGDTTWFWSDGTSFTFTFWCQGEPNNPDKQHCLQMNYSGKKCWDDLQCDRRLPSVCVKYPVILVKFHG